MNFQEKTKIECEISESSAPPTAVNLMYGLFIFTNLKFTFELLGRSFIVDVPVRNQVISLSVCKSACLIHLRKKERKRRNRQNIVFNKSKKGKNSVVCCRFRRCTVKKFFCPPTMVGDILFTSFDLGPLTI